MKYCIKKKFSKASNTYHIHDDVQRCSANILVEKFINHNIDFIPNVILDVGCGTGNLIHSLYKKFPHAKYHLNDISHAMLEETALQFRGMIDFRFVYGDIEECSIIDNYDLICSNMCLQWVFDLQNTIKKLRLRSKIFAFSYLLQGSFAEWYDLLKQYGVYYRSPPYYSVSGIMQILSHLHAKILYQSSNNFELLFDNPYQVIKYLKALGAHTAYDMQYNIGNLYKMLKTHDKVCKIKYNIGFFIIRGDL